MTSVEIFVVIVAAVLGYLTVSHFMERGPRETPSSPSPTQTENSPPWHVVLGVAEDADADEIRRAYREQMSRYHPDKVDGLGPEFTEIAQRKAQAINAAYEEGLRRNGLRQ